VHIVAVKMVGEQIELFHPSPCGYVLVRKWEWVPIQCTVPLGFN